MTWIARLVVFALGVAMPALASAQDAPALSIRPFVSLADESFAAKTTFDAVFGKPTGSLVGGGVSLVIRDRVYVDLGAAQFKATGQRAFLNAGTAYRLGIPLAATLTPFEVTAGWRFHLSNAIRPYAGAGFGSYAYKESSDFASAGDDIDTRHAGLVAEGGVEVRLHRWIGVSGDVRYSHVSGILGQGGLSKDAGESDLGGVAGRVRVIVGR